MFMAGRACPILLLRGVEWRYMTVKNLVSLISGGSHSDELVVPGAIVFLEGVLSGNETLSNRELMAIYDKKSGLYRIGSASASESRLELLYVHAMIEEAHARQFSSDHFAYVAFDLPSVAFAYCEAGRFGKAFAILDEAHGSMEKLGEGGKDFARVHVKNMRDLIDARHKAHSEKA